MFIAMNRFKVRKGEERAFEARWLERDSHIRGEPGFVEFHLLKGPEHEDHVLYASHTVWRSQADFDVWTRSDAFRAAHRDAGEGRPLTISRPEFEGFEVLQILTPAIEGHPELGGADDAGAVRAPASGGGPRRQNKTSKDVP